MGIASRQPFTSDGPASKLKNRKKTKGKEGPLDSSSDDEETVTGAVVAGKTKLMKGSGVKNAQVKLFKINFLRNFFNSLIRGFSQPGGGRAKRTLGAERPRNHIRFRAQI